MSQAEEVSHSRQGLLIPYLAYQGLKTSLALPLWFKLVEMMGWPESRKCGYVFASQKTLARELGYSSEPNGTFRNGARTVQRQLNDLHARGLVHWVRARMGNRYYLDPASPQEAPSTQADKGDKNVALPTPNVACQATKMSPAYTDSEVVEEKREGEGARPARRASGPVHPKTRAPQPKKPDPNHRPLVDFFCTSWREKYGAHFPFNSNAGANARAVTAILRAANGDLVEAKRIVRAYFDDPDQWIAGHKHPLLYLAKYVQRYIGNGEPLVNEHGLYTRRRVLTPEEITRLEEEAKADAGKHGQVYA